MKYKVVTTWTVEVSDTEVQRAAKGYGKDVDPKQLATFKAVQKSIEVAMGGAQWDNEVAVYFDVELKTTWHSAKSGRSAPDLALSWYTLVHKTQAQ